MVIGVRGDDRMRVAKAKQAGLAVDALSDWRLQQAGPGGLLLSLTNVASYKMAQHNVAILRNVIGRES